VKIFKWHLQNQLQKPFSTHMELRNWLFGFFTLCILTIAGCGYRFDGGELESRTVTISIPYIKGDLEGHLNAELVRALSNTGFFDCVQNGGELLLEATIIGDGDDRIGYRFDRNPESGELRDNIVGTENRRTMIATVTVIDTATHASVLGPQTVKAHGEYDYVDSNSIRDLTFFTRETGPQKVLDFSLGQLDSVEGAHDDISMLIYKRMAQTIVDGLLIVRAKDLSIQKETKEEKTGEEKIPIEEEL
jgi:hypothetical protein